VDVPEFVEAVDHARVVAAIRAAEARSAGEICVHVSKAVVEDAYAAAAAHFAEQGMTATREHNAVLIYVAPRSRKLAIVGDAGIHAKCGPGFWRDVAEAMSADFRDGRFTDGLVKGIARAGEVLAAHFPRRRDDANELPDEVTEQ
jgi:uncharacterized membrane protein